MKFIPVGEALLSPPNEEATSTVHAGRRVPSYLQTKCVWDAVFHTEIDAQVFVAMWVR